MKVKYNGDGERELWGTVFPSDSFVTVEDKELLVKCRNMGCFDIVDNDGEPATVQDPPPVKRGPGRPRKVQA